MEDKKLAAIQAAYGDAWEKAKEYVDENGWIWSIHMHRINPGFAPFAYNYFRGSWRPVELCGLETNNGWISCEDRLPDEGLKVWIVIDGHVQDHPTYLHEIRIQPQFGNTVTHWKPVEEVKPPIY